VTDAAAPPPQPRPPLAEATAPAPATAAAYPPAPPPAGPERALARLARALAQRPALTLGLALLVVAAAGLASRGVGVDPGNEALFLSNDPARGALETFRRLFEEDQTVVVALEGPVMTEEGLARLERLRSEVAVVPGVVSALAITNARNIYRGPVEAYGHAPYESVKDGDRTVEDFAAEVLREPLFAGNLVSADGRTAAIIAPVANRGAAAVEDLRAAARRASDGAFTAHVAGLPVERVDFAATIDRDQRVFVPLVVAMLALLTALLFRQLWGTALPLAVVGASVATTLGAAALLGKELNAVTSMLTPVVMVVSVAVSVNFCTAYAQARDEAPGAARADLVERAIGRVGLPCLFTTGTTVAGFGSLAASDVPAIRDFGTLSALGVALSYALALAVLPPLLALPWPGGPGSLHVRPGRIEDVLARAAPALERGRAAVLGAAALLVLLALAGVARIRVETDILGTLPESGDLRRAVAAIDRSLAGVNAVEVLVEGPPGAFRGLEGARALEALQGWFEARGGVAKTFSVADVLKRIHDVKRGRRALPEDGDTVGVYFGLLERTAAAAPSPATWTASLGPRDRGPADPLHGLVSRDFAAARVIARLRAAPSSAYAALLRDFAAETPALLPQGIRARATGEFVLLQNMTAALPYAMLEGLLWATALIVGSMGLLFRSLRLAALAAVPASIPIVAVYGIMGWTGIALSVPTSMISSVVLGLAVDSTILFLSRYKDERAAGLARRDAVAAMLRHAGQSVTYSNLTLICGFAVGFTSRFPPIRDFGVLTSLTIAASYLVALTLLPALIFLQRPGSITGRDGGGRTPWRFARVGCPC
jgi:hypothetical protein